MEQSEQDFLKAFCLGLEYKRKNAEELEQLRSEEPVVSEVSTEDSTASTEDAQ